MWHVIQALLITLGICFIVLTVLVLASVCRHPARNLKIIIPTLGVIAALVMIDCSYPLTHINQTGTIAYKKYVPVHNPGQSHYAVLVVSGEQHWLFRVSKKQFYHRLRLDARVPLISYTGPFSGHVYKTTLN